MDSKVENVKKLFFFASLDPFFASSVVHIYIHTYLARSPEIGQGRGRILSCGARKPEQI